MKLALCSGIVGKDIPAIARNNKKFRNVDIDRHELAIALTELGWAICAQHIGNRSAANVTCTGFLAVDIDEGLTIEQALADDYVKRFAAVVYTTANHSTEAHRFRIVFELEAPLTDVQDIQLALTGLSARFGGDKACTDASRIFFGVPEAEMHLLQGSLPPDEVARLIQQGREKTASKRLRAVTGGSTRVRSRISIAIDAQVTTAGGERVSIWDVAPGTSVFCPNHVDRRPSAFVIRSSNQKPGISCSACLVTMFPDGAQPTEDSEYLRHDLAAILQSYKPLRSASNCVNPYQGARIQTFNERYFPYPNDCYEMILSGRAQKRYETSVPLDLPPGLWAEHHWMFVRSPMGTGKTEFLAARIAAYLRIGARVLLVGNRRSLLAALAERLGLTNYLNDETDAFRLPSEGFAVCLDSLPKVNPTVWKYDVVVIDECQGVFAHLRSSTLADKRAKVLDHLRHFIRNAGQVILLDADLGKLTLDVWSEITAGQSRSSLFVINKWKPADRVIHLYEERRSHRQLLGDLVADLRHGRRCYVACNSKVDAELIAAEAPKCVHGRTIRTICITGANSRTPHIQEFIRNIRSAILDFDLIVTSPAVASGIDITFPDNKSEIDTVYGIFHPLVTTHYEIDQQLARVRNPGAVRVWISDEEFLFETDPGAIQAEIWAAEEEHHTWVGTSESGEPKFLPNDLNDTVFVAVAAQERASKNSLRKNFVSHKKAAGWALEWIAADANASRVGGKLLKEGRELRKHDEIQAILTAKKISGDDYKRLRLKKKLGRHISAEDKHAMRRREIESFYRTEVSEELIRFDDKGRGRAGVRNLIALTSTVEELERLDHWEERKLVADRKQWKRRSDVLRALLEPAGLMVDGTLSAEAKVSARNLGAFCIALEQPHIKESLQRLFDLAPRADVRRKPVRQLTEILKLIKIGIDDKAGRHRKGGVDIVSYRIDAASLATVMEHVQRRRQDPLGDLDEAAD